MIHGNMVFNVISFYCCEDLNDVKTLIVASVDEQFL